MKTGLNRAAGVGVLIGMVWIGSLDAADPPCDRYAASQQARCQTIWKELNDQAVQEVAHFGLAQQKRRDAGELSPDQHLAENLAFIKQSTDQRLKRLHERMAESGGSKTR